MLDLCFTITKTFFQILNGEADELNGKSHPWSGTRDPRLDLFSTGAKKGIPYGIPSQYTQTLRANTPNWYSSHAGHLAMDFTVPLMTYAELQFILSEYNGFSDDEFQKGIEASIKYWASVYGESVEADAIESYKTAVGTATAEKVALQKYIDLWLNGTEAWTEIRRTGYPEQILRPGEKAAEVTEDGKTKAILFEPLSDVKGDIIARVKYPTNESTLNGANWKEAVAKLDDGTNNYYTKMFWDVRKSTYDHPANK